MKDLRSADEVNDALTSELARAAGPEFDPNAIMDSSKIYAAPPPPGSLALPPDGELVKGTIAATARRLLGQKISTRFQPTLVPAEALDFQTFKPLAAAVYRHINSVALSAAYLAVCCGLVLEPKEVDADTPIKHLNDDSAEGFVRRLEECITRDICNGQGFQFTNQQRAEVIAARRVAAAMDVVIDSVRRCL